MNDSIKREQSQTSLNSAERENYRTKCKNFKSTAWILPQPVLIIGTYDKGGACDVDNITGGHHGKSNAMNAAWGGQWDMHEIIISLGSHATTDNLAENPEFTVTFATAGTMLASDYVGIVSGRNTPDKMEKTGWTIEKAPNVNAPVFKEFPMTLECRIKQKGGNRDVDNIVGGYQDLYVDDKPFLALIASLLKKGVEVRLIRANDDGLKTR